MNYVFSSLLSWILIPIIWLNIRRKKMKKIISIILGAVVALNLSLSVVNAAAKEVRIAFF